MDAFRYYTIEPSAALAGYVRSFWVFEGQASPELPYIYRSMADPCAEFVFHYQGEFFELDDEDKNLRGSDPLSGLQAPARTFRRYQTHENFGIFGAYLYPFAIADLLRLSCVEISGEQIALQDSLGFEGRILSERILTATTNRSRAEILSEFLLQKLSKPSNADDRVQQLIRLMLHQSQPSAIGTVASEIFVSQRQLERKFKTFTGFSPKTWSRLIRFQHALNQYGGHHRSLAEIAYETGYYDQSHFIHDFKEFSGYEPGIYFAGKSEGIEFRDAE